MVSPVLPPNQDDKTPRLSLIQENKKLQDKTKQTASKRIERDRLKMVIRNLSLLKLLKSSNSRIQELHSLARKCWNSIIRVPKILQISSGDNNVCKKVKEKSEELQKAGSLKKQLESIGEPTEPRSKDWKPKLESKLENKAKEPHVMVPREQKCPKGPRTSSGVGLRTRAQGRQLRSKGPQILFLKVYHHRTPMGDKKQPGVDDQWVWFDGLPTRVRVPGPRVMCRPSALRSAKRCCTRFCSASLEMPMRRQYKVGVRTPPPPTGPETQPSGPERGSHSQQG
ncbi:TP53-target gene 5 protein [Perognathus longimembris pacificus]|uniref:TP53-target gene 5 protein n=1 Tax=Perognathus longimembris pacificus TaxID=214514 RepID=UPI002018C5F2|nr:TP53-target gene 5 protein [Perognathus longimembris pacificus]